MATIMVDLSTYYDIVNAYEALKVVDSASASDVSSVLESLKAALGSIDISNSLTRYYLYVKWHDLSANPADYADYPPQETSLLHSYTAFTEQYVQDFVAAQTDRYANILVTDDPSGTVGWVELSTFFS